MTLPPRIRKEPKSDGRWRCPAHRTYVKKHACANCGATRDIHFAHVRMGSHTGMSQKPHDYLGVSLCGNCHLHEQHRVGEPTFWENYQKRTGQSVWQLIEAFCADSPKAWEIKQHRMQERYSNG